MTTTLDGDLITIDGRPALCFERRYPQPIERVWRAITEPDELAHWFPSNVEGERAVGAELHFLDDEQRAAAQEAGEPTRVDGPMFRGTVVAYDPPSVFSFTWGSELLRFELSPDGDGTRLVFTQVLSHQSVAARNGAGWHTCLGALSSLLEVPDEGGADWPDVYADYIERIGPELGAPTSNGGMTWERSTHVEPERVRAATTEPGELAAWGATDAATETIRWDVESTERGTVYRLRHDHIDGDPTQAARWHALLLQLDMYLAAGQLVPADPASFVDDYTALL